MVLLVLQHCALHRIGGNTGTGTGTGTMVTGNGAVLVNSNIAVGGTTQIMATNGGNLTVVSSNPASLRSPAMAPAPPSPAFRLARRPLLLRIPTTGTNIGYGTFTVTVGSGTGTGTGATITSQSIQVGGTATILATSGVISYAQSGSPTVASVTTSGGLATVTGLRAGTATITYMTSTGRRAPSP